MKKIIYICDKCEKEIEGNPYRVTVDRLFAEPPEQEVKGIMSPHPYPDMDGLHFCKECVGALVDLIRRHLKPNTENEDPEPENTEEVATSQPDPLESRPEFDREPYIALKSTLRCVAFVWDANDSDATAAVKALMREANRNKRRDR